MRYAPHAARSNPGVDTLMAFTNPGWGRHGSYSTGTGSRGWGYSSSRPKRRAARPITHRVAPKVAKRKTPLSKLHGAAKAARLNSLQKNKRRLAALKAARARAAAKTKPSTPAQRSNAMARKTRRARRNTAVRANRPPSKAARSRAAKLGHARRKRAAGKAKTSTRKLARRSYRRVLARAYRRVARKYPGRSKRSAARRASGYRKVWKRHGRKSTLRRGARAAGQRQVRRRKRGLLGRFLSGTTAPRKRRAKRRASSARRLTSGKTTRKRSSRKGRKSSVKRKKYHPRPGSKAYAKMVERDYGYIRNNPRRKRRRRNFSRVVGRTNRRRSRRNMYAPTLGPKRFNRRRGRRNPFSLGGNGLMGIVKSGAVAFGAVALGRALNAVVQGLVTKYGAGKLPQVVVDNLGVAVAGLSLVLGHVATKKVAPLAKYRGMIMAGLAFNLAEVVVRRVAASFGASVPAALQPAFNAAATGVSGVQFGYVDNPYRYMSGMGRYIDTQRPDVVQGMGLLEAPAGMGEYVRTPMGLLEAPAGFRGLGDATTAQFPWSGPGDAGDAQMLPEAGVMEESVTPTGIFSESAFGGRPAAMQGYR